MEVPLSAQLYYPYQLLISDFGVSIQHRVYLLSLPIPTQIVAFYIVYLDRVVIV